MKSRWIVSLCAALLVLACAACAETAPPTPTLVALANLPKQFATVPASPTPGDAERQATRAAEQRRTGANASPTVPPSPTVYVGIFIGANQMEGGDLAPRSTSVGVGAVATLPVAACLIPPDAQFGTAWQNIPSIQQMLGCPGEPATPYVGTTQIFERGVMYGLPSGEIYTIALSAGGARYWYAPTAPPEQTWTVPVPEGLRLPTQAFGAVWRATDGVRSALGFARTDQQAASLVVQRFDRGALLFDGSAGQVFVLAGGVSVVAATGSAFGPY